MNAKGMTSGEKSHLELKFVFFKILEHVSFNYVECNEDG